MINIVIAGLFSVTVASLVYWLLERSSQRTIADFHKAFPRKCFICSYHRFGVMEGYVSGPVEKHDCPKVIKREEL